MNIKRIIKLVAGAVFGITLGFNQSCDFLDIDPYINDLPTLDSVFSRRESTLQYLANVYSFLPDGGSPQGSPWVPISDECLCTYQDESAYFNYFSNNNMSAHSSYFVRWAGYYQGIRNASVFLRKVGECKELTPIQLKEYTGEAHFLRAYFYFQLMKQYGPVPIAPVDGFPLDSQMGDLLVPRNTWDECVDFVTDELKNAAANLPEIRPSTDFGKPTKGAAYAVLSRLLLYHASPLFNGNTSYADFVDKETGVPYINPVYDDSKWAEAAWAARQVIDLGYELYHVEADDNTPVLPESFSQEDKADFPGGAGGIDPYKSYSQLFNGAVLASDNKEVIYGRSVSGIVSWVQQMAPYTMGDKGSSSFNLTHNLAEAYYMADGRTPESASAAYPYDEQHFSTDIINFSGYRIPSETNGMNLNREARFYATVGFCNSFYYGISTTGNMKNFACLFYYGEENGKDKVQTNSSSNDKYCMTGYLCRKFLHNEDNFQRNGIVRHKIWIDYRLAEIYLNYAEALNELKGSHTVGGVAFSRNPEEIRKYFNLVRHRAGLPGMTVAEAADYNKVKELIRRERQIELAWEGHRYFDARRWKIAVDVENEPIWGMDISQTAENKDLFYRKTQVREKNYTKKTFIRRQNFWPIPNDEIVRNPHLVQSPGW